MKRKFVFFWAAIAACVMMTACSSESEDEMVNGQSSMVNDKADVVLTFSPYDVSPMTRTAVSIADVVNHLNVWLVSGSDVIALQQTTSDANFGTITATLDKTKTYTMYAVAHKADGATLTDGVVAFTDDKVTHSMWYTTTFSPSTTTSLACEMTRIVADFRLEITDEIPTAVKKLRFTISDVFDRWSVTDGGTHQLDRTSIINYNGTSAVFNIYAITTDAQTLHTVTVEALDADGNALVPAQQKVFENVPLRNGYKTTYRGAFFTEENMTMTFTVNDWNEYETVDF